MRTGELLVCMVRGTHHLEVLSSPPSIRKRTCKMKKSLVALLYKSTPYNYTLLSKDGSKHCINLRSAETGCHKSSQHLFNLNVLRVWSDGSHVDDRVSHLERPRVHDVLHGHRQGQRAVSVAGLRQVAPQVVLHGRAVLAGRRRWVEKAFVVM